MKTSYFDLRNTRLKATVFENDLFSFQSVVPIFESVTILKLLNYHQPQRTN